MICRQCGQREAADGLGWCRPCVDAEEARRAALRRREMVVAAVTSTPPRPDNPRAIELLAERQALNDRMRDDPKQRTAVNYGRRDAIDKMLKRFDED